MIRLGRTWGNLMVELVATNAKLRGRVVHILEEASGRAPDEVHAARRALASHDGSVAAALAALAAR